MTNELTQIEMPPYPADKLLAFLADPGSYPHTPRSVQIIQTHISYVAVAPPYVYKVKKTLALGFLDFSTLPKRKFYCEEEVRLNRRLCAPIYDAVVPIFASAGGALSFDSDGEIVEYAVRMAQLEDGRFMHQLLAAGKIGRDHLDRLVARLVSFYKAQQPSNEVAEWGRIDRLRVSTDENFEQTADQVGSLLERPAFEAIRFFVDRFFECNASLFARRRTGGRIVDGHGDLRAEHVHVDEDRICIYDCIEFSERLRYIDIANDIAFLSMDLDFHGRPDLSNYFATRLSDALDDADLLQLLSFYKCYRAYVRGKVEGMRAEEREVPAAERESSRRRAQRLYRLAMDYAASGNSPTVLVTMGRVGTGKSTMAVELGRALGWPVISSDRTRKEIAGVPAEERGDEAARERLYAPQMTTRTYQALLRSTVERGREHHSTILDATYGSPEEREALRRSLGAEGIKHRFVETTASDEVIRSRLRARDSSRGIVSDARLEDFDALDARYVAPGPREDTYHIRVTSEQDPAASTLETLRQLVRLNG